jgi:homoserine O-acetyltransferase
MIEPTQAVWIASEFKFHTGEVMPELRIGYITLGDPYGIPVLILHGTTGSAQGLLTPEFAGELFGPGQVLDASKYFIVMPDAVGAGQSSKPSDGLRMQFPHYNYMDMVHAQYRLLTEGLGLTHVRMVLGNSMGGMHAWLWGTLYPDFMDLLVPMAATPAAMSGRNWMTRRWIIDAIRNDPAWRNGNYTTQPPSLQFASVFFAIATNGGDQHWQQLAPTRAAADALLAQRLQAPFVGDANDHLYVWNASRDYDPSPWLNRIQARVLAITSADDERNPPSLGILAAQIAKIPGAEWFLIPASAHTCGHATTSQAMWWKHALQRLLQDDLAVDHR